MWKDIFLQKYHETINLTDRFSQRHRSSKIFPDLLIWGRDGKSLNCHMIHRKLLYNSSLNCKPTGRVIVLDNCHNHSNHNVSNFVADMRWHSLQGQKFNVRILLVTITCKKGSKQCINVLVTIVITWMHMLKDFGDLLGRGWRCG